MTVQLLDAIRAEIEPLEQRLEVLRQMERLWRGSSTTRTTAGAGEAPAPTVVWGDTTAPALEHRAADWRLPGPRPPGHRSPLLSGGR
jgi:hypothetical protein